MGRSNRKACSIKTFSSNFVQFENKPFFISALILRGFERKLFILRLMLRRINEVGSSSNCTRLWDLL